MYPDNVSKKRLKKRLKKRHSRPKRKTGYVRIKKKSVIIIIIAVVLLLLAAAAITVFLNKRGPSLDKNAIAYQLPDGVKNTDPDSILLPGFDVIKVNYSTQKADAALLNPEGNECYFQYSVTLKSDGTKLYQTGLIKPGTAVAGFKLNKKLEKGKYPIVILVEATDLKDAKVKYNGGAVEAALEVK